MLTLLKQARAYGLGCILATQNPVDLDYKGLSNAGTWFLGRLQTERDKSRVIEGLEGASAQAGSTFNRQQMERTLAALGSRVFLMNNVHDDVPIVFHTRWAMSYLCGPLTRDQIKRLIDPVRAKYAPPAELATNPADGNAAAATNAATSPAAAHRPVLPAGIREQFIAINERIPDGYVLEYRPGLLGQGKVHFVRKGENIDVWRDCIVLQTIRDSPADDVWSGASVGEQELITEDRPDDRGVFADLPSEMSREKSYPIFTRQLKEHLYREEALKLWSCPLLDLVSTPEEGEEAFRIRLAPMLAAKLSGEREKLAAAQASKLADADDRVRRAQARLSTQRWQFLARIGSIAWIVADTIMSALGRGLPGRRRSLDPALRSVATERGQQSNAQASLDSALQEKQRLEQQYREQLKELELNYGQSGVKLEPLELKPLKSDIVVDKVSLVWLPWRISASGSAEPVY
jgi:hypothetical protein